MDARTAAPTNLAGSDVALLPEVVAAVQAACAQLLEAGELPAGEWWVTDPLEGGDGDPAADPHR